jgi:hypothetical protein
MRRIVLFGIPVVCAALGSGLVVGQAPIEQQRSQMARVSDASQGPVVLEYVPPALQQLSAQAAMKSSFTLDRTMLGAVAGLMGNQDEDFRQSMSKLDGVSIHTWRFAGENIVDPAEVDAVRESYHLRGWKHLVTTTNAGGPLHNGTTDVWLVMDGTNLRGAVVLAETRKSLTLVTVAGNLSPVDLLHLRGHFGIPRFDGDGLRGEIPSGPSDQQ